MKGRAELLRLALGAVVSHRLRSGLTMLGIVIGIASVILLTSLGEGTRESIFSEFSQFGTNTMVIHRGKTKTTGVMGTLGGTIRKLTLEDSEALRRVPGVEQIVPVSMGSARVAAGTRGRSVRRCGSFRLAREGFFRREIRGELPLSRSSVRNSSVNSSARPMRSASTCISAAGDSWSSA